MPFPMKIQPIDADAEISIDQAKPVVKSRFKRLFERQLIRISSSEKLAGGDPEPSSVVLDKMVRNFMEGTNNEKSSSRNRCNCFNGNFDGSPDDDLELAVETPVCYPADAGEILKGLVVCASVIERNLAADASSIMEKMRNSSSRGKGEPREILTEGLRSLGYDAAICKSRWEKTPSYPAGEHKYIDVVVNGDRIVIDVDFRSEFEIARSTKSYRALLQSLPSIFVGTTDRVAEIVTVVSEAAKASLKKKGLHFPPWRMPEYMRAKWLSPVERETRGEVSVFDFEVEAEGREEETVTWQPPAVRPKKSSSGTKVVTGLAAVLRT